METLRPQYARLNEGIVAVYYSQLKNGDENMTRKLEDIGFYTLSDQRARDASQSSPIMRAEILLTDKCNFHCPYCRGVAPSIAGEIPVWKLQQYLDTLVCNQLKNVRFTGGEPTLYRGLEDAVYYCTIQRVEHIAISTNGSASMNKYQNLINLGVNDFSISLDGACCAVGDKMSGGATGAWNKVVANIKEIAKQTYVSLGMVFTELNVDQCLEAVKFAESLGVADIRVIPSAQYNKALVDLSMLPENELAAHPILHYRVKNISSGVPVRGLQSFDSTRCPLVLDDVAIAGDYHFPCVIYMREQGAPIGKMSADFRRERLEWFQKFEPHKSQICRNNCLDVCREYNNKWTMYHSINSPQETSRLPKRKTAEGGFEKQVNKHCYLWAPYDLS